MTKKTSYFSVLIMTVIAMAAFYQPCYSQEKATKITGKVESVRDREANMDFYWLIPKNGKRIFLGAPFEIDEDTSKLCVSQAADNEINITLEGIITNEGGELNFLDNKFRCIAHQSNVKITSGFFISNGENKQTVILYDDGTGLYQEEGSIDEPFSWEQKGNSLSFDFGEQAKILSPTSFEMSGCVYNLDQNNVILSYNYNKAGSGGNLRLTQLDDYLLLSVKTVNLSSFKSCSFNAACTAKNNKLICEAQDIDTGDDNYNFIISFENGVDAINLVSTYQKRYFCEVGADFEGRYVKK